MESNKIDQNQIDSQSENRRRVSFLCRQKNGKKRKQISRAVLLMRIWFLPLRWVILHGTEIKSEWDQSTISNTVLPFYSNSFFGQPQPQIHQSLYLSIQSIYLAFLLHNTYSIRRYRNTEIRTIQNKDKLSASRSSLSNLIWLYLVLVCL